MRAHVAGLPSVPRRQFAILIVAVLARGGCGFTNVLIFSDRRAPLLSSFIDHNLGGHTRCPSLYDTQDEIHFFVCVPPRP